MEKTSVYWEKEFGNLQNFHKRILCYALRIGLYEIYENARDNNIKFTKWLQNRCCDLIYSLAMN